MGGDFVSDSFGRRMRSLRVEKKITLDELAEKMGTTKATLSRYENNQRKPTGEFVREISDFFDVFTDYLLGKTDEKSSNEKTEIHSINDEYIEIINYAREKKISAKKLKMMIDVIDDQN
jgi:transcriptional regulator with XRE-family HTH domain